MEGAMNANNQHNELIRNMREQASLARELSTFDLPKNLQVIKPWEAPLNIESQYILEAPNEQNAVQIMFRVYENRDRIRVLWLGISNYFEVVIDLKTGNIGPYKNFNYKGKGKNSNLPAHRFRLGSNC